MADKTDDQKACELAYERLHHLSMRYVGAFIEAATGEGVALLPQKHPGLREMRDLIDLILIARAEINALTAICHRKGVFDQGEIVRQMTEEIKFIEEQKAKFLGVTVTDVGLTFHNPYTQQ